MLLVCAALGIGAFFNVYQFFAVSERVDAPFLAVEGWIEVHGIAAAVAEARERPYQRVFVTGGPLRGTGGYVSDERTAAKLGATRLCAAGLSESLVQMVPSRVSARDRTYSSALALRAWCEENNVPLTSINVITVDVHARRTRLLFQKALGGSVRVGVISVPNPDYDARRWWRYSEGVRAVLGECIAYVYAAVFFRP